MDKSLKKEIIVEVWFLDNPLRVEWQVLDQIEACGNIRRDGDAVVKAMQVKEGAREDYRAWQI